jgi:transposase InsO family protein
MCQLLEVSPSAFYEWQQSPQSNHELQDEKLKAKISEIFAAEKSRYGAPRITEALADQAIPVSRKRVARIMRTSGLRASGKRKFKHTTDSNHALPVAPNRLNQQFQTAQPNQVWVGDITYIRTREGWSYLATVIDLYSRKVVGWSYSDRMTRALVCDALDAAVSIRHPEPGLIFHSDRGSQYASHAFRRRLWRYRMQQSMSGKGNCYDNAVAESFFATLKKELVRNGVYRTRQEARAALFQYIEVFYNRRRLHSFLGYMTPEQFESCKQNQRVA